MKKQKLKLNDLKVNSYVTSIDFTEKKTVKGGETAVLCLIVGTIGLTIASYAQCTNIGRDIANFIMPEGVTEGNCPGYQTPINACPPPLFPKGTLPEGPHF